MLAAAVSTSIAYIYCMSSPSAPFIGWQSLNNGFIG